MGKRLDPENLKINKGRWEIKINPEDRFNAAVLKGVFSDIDFTTGFYGSVTHLEKAGFEFDNWGSRDLQEGEIKIKSPDEIKKFIYKYADSVPIFLSASQKTIEKIDVELTFDFMPKLSNETYESIVKGSKWQLIEAPGNPDILVGIFDNLQIAGQALKHLVDIGVVEKQKAISQMLWPAETPEDEELSLVLSGKEKKNIIEIYPNLGTEQAVGVSKEAIAEITSAQNCFTEKTPRQSILRKVDTLLEHGGIYGVSADNMNNFIINTGRGMGL